ncbi:MAG: GDP-mannose 4,6-dehydratase [Candidatus Omnitrophota bacterium]|nr:GDP-mannose 4,6-dehydratase [Candidatus Omnitrophota bacterium]
MNILVTGGAGFIGSHLVEKLLERGDNVFVIDDLSTGSIKNIEHLKHNQKFHYVIDTIFNEAVLRELIDECDLIFHLAAAVGVFLVIQDPVATIERNVHGTELVLKYANFKKKKVIFTSTSEIYGKSPKNILKEDDDIVFGPTKNRRWSYACSKAIDEFLALAYFENQGLPIVIARIFNTVGPRQVGRYGMVVPRFIGSVLKNEPLLIFGDGKQTRCFCHVLDTVRALIGLADSRDTQGEIFNIGNPQEISIINLAERIKSAAKSTSGLKFIPYDEAYEEGFEDMKRRVPDISKIKKYINFTPTLNLDTIISDIIKWFNPQ